MSDAVSRRRMIYHGSKIDLALEPYRRSDGTDAERELVIHRGAVALVPMVDEPARVPGGKRAVCRGQNPARSSRRHDRPRRVTRADGPA